MSKPYTVLDTAKEESQLLREFASDVLEGLSAEPKSLPCKYIYDEHGSRLFSRIMELPEYYLTDCETEILETYKDRICKRTWSAGLNVVELGAGDGKKTRIILEHLIGQREGFNYVPIDISESAVEGLACELGRKMPELDMHGLVAEYMRGINWLSCNTGGRRNLVLFLGSSIGNFHHSEARSFLRALRSSMGSDDYLLLGVDLKKDVRVMTEAYDDSSGLTARFNLNLLERINRELGGDFDSGNYRFHCTWDKESGAIQSYLVSRKEQEVSIDGLDSLVHFHSGERIHTESSYKYTQTEVNSLAADSGFKVVENFRDSKGYFLDVLLGPA